LKILIYNSGGGLGDSIQLFDLITTLKDKFGQDNLYYLTSHNNHFNNSLKEYNILLKELKTNIVYFGFRWQHLIVSKKKILKKNLINKFDLIIDLQSKFRNSLILKQFPSNNFYSSTFNFKLCNIKKDFIVTKYEIKNIILNLEKLLEINIPYKRYDINRIDKKFFDEAKKLLPDKNYVGFSITQGNEYRKKSWPLKNVINLAKKISKNNKIPVFFIERSNLELISKIKSEINNALFPELETSLLGPPLVSALSTRLDKAVSIDNGIMHMIALANIPMIVLFGPTNSKKFAPKIDKINILDSKLIYNSNNILKISEDDVFNLI
jgi:ADP-heptose:LPS heptosyltransferase